MKVNQGVLLNTRFDKSFKALVVSTYGLGIFRTHY